MKNNFFIVIEGIDNSGKTTLIELIKEQLTLPENSSILNYFDQKIYFTSEPYGPNKEAKYAQLSDLIFSEKYSFETISEAYLFLAMRADHLSNFIIPKLQENSLIFCDRYYLSTLAYQSYLKKIDKSFLDLNMKYISQNIKPLITFVLEISKENHIRFQRDKNLKHNNKYDSLNLFTYENLVQAYDWGIKYLQSSGEKVTLIPNAYDWTKKAQLIISYIKELIQ